MAANGSAAERIKNQKVEEPVEKPETEVTDNPGLTAEQNAIREKILMLDKAGQEKIKKFMSSTKLKDMDGWGLKELKRFVDMLMKDHRAA